MSSDLGKNIHQSLEKVNAGLPFRNMTQQDGGQQDPLKRCRRGDGRDHRYQWFWCW
jgi:hypothetical protein